MEAFAKGRSVIIDFDVMLAKRRFELQKITKKFDARAIFIGIKTPERLLLVRLRKKHYTKNEILQNAKEAIRVYFIRKKLHEKLLHPKPNFVINNARPLAPQIRNLIKELGL